MNNCVCVNYFSRLQHQISTMISSYFAMQMNTNLPSTDSGVIRTEDPFPQSDPGFTDRINLDAIFYTVMLIIGVVMLYSSGLSRRRQVKSTLPK